MATISYPNLRTPVGWEETRVRRKRFHILIGVGFGGIFNFVLKLFCAVLIFGM